MTLGNCLPLFGQLMSSGSCWFSFSSSWQSKTAPREPSAFYCCLWMNWFKASVFQRHNNVVWWQSWWFWVMWAPIPSCSPFCFHAWKLTFQLVASVSDGKQTVSSVALLSCFVSFAVVQTVCFLSKSVGFILSFICPLQMSFICLIYGIYFCENIQNLTVNTLSNLFHFTYVSYCCPVVAELLHNLNMKFKHSFLKFEMETPTSVFLHLPLFGWQFDPIVDHVFSQQFSFHFIQFFLTNRFFLNVLSTVLPSMDWNHINPMPLWFLLHVFSKNVTPNHSCIWSTSYCIIYGFIIHFLCQYSVFQLFMS